MSLGSEIEDEAERGQLSSAAARNLEYSLIGLGILGLLLIFQPFSLALFGLGCGLVVLAGLANNLLPLCKPGTPIRSVVTAALLVALIFLIVLLLSIAAAYLYGVWFVQATAPDTSDPFYRQPFVWGIAVVATLIAAIIAALNRTGRR